MKEKRFASGMGNLTAAIAALFLLCGYAGAALAAEKPEIFPQLGQSGWIQRVAMSNDGKYVLTGDFGGTVMLWEAETGREIRKLTGHSHLDTIAFTPDGKYALASNTGIVKLWDIRTGREVYTAGETDYSLGTGVISFLSGGKYFMISAPLSRPRVWETATGREMGGLTLPKDFIARSGQLIATPRSRLALTQTYDRVKMRQEPAQLWDLLTGKVIREFVRSLPYHSVFTADGKVLSARYEDNAIELWDPATDRTIWKSPGHTKSVDYVAVSANGAVAVSASKDDGTLRVWEAATGRPLQTIAMPRGFRPNALSPDGKKIFLLDGAFFGDHKTARLYDTMTGREIKAFTKDEFESMAFTPDGRLILMRFGKVALWDIPSGREVQRFEGSGQAVTGMAFAPKRNVAAMMSGKTVNIWDIAAGKRLAVLNGHVKEVAGAAFSPDGGTLATGSLDNTVRLWDLKTGRETLSLTAHAGGAVSVVWSPDGRYLASAGNDAVIKLWNGATGALVKTLTGHTKKQTTDVNKTFTGIYNVAFSPDGKRLVSCGTDGKIIVWDVATGREIKTLRGGHKDDVTAVAWSPDGRMLVSGGWDTTVRTWDVNSGRELKTLGKTEFASVASVVWSPDGRYIAARGSGDEISHLWDVASGKEIRSFSGTKVRLTATGMMNTALFSRDSRFLLTNDGFGGISRIWDIATGRELAQFISFTDGEWIAFTPEGYFNASADGARHLNVRVGIKVYAIDQFYSKFYRPELVELALTGKELPKGEEIGDIAAQKPAPAVQILSPAARSSVDADSVEVTVRITDAGGGIGPVTIYLNGAQVANDTRGVAVKARASDREKTLSFTVPLVAGPNEIRAVAGNRDNSMESNPAIAIVVSRAAAKQANLYALVIGINTYRNTSISLTYAVPDAVAFAETLRKVAAPLFGKTDVRVLTTPDATTKEAIVKAFEEMRKTVKPNDLFIFYNASHGLVDVVNGEEQYFLLTSNVRLLSSHRLAEDALGQKELASLIGGIPAQKKVVILDTCNAGKGGKEIQLALLTQTRGLTDATAVKLLHRAVGSSVFSASSDSQQALEGYKGHGLFTYVLIEGLQGKADFKKDGFITVKGLALHTEERVMTLSEEVFKRQQNPMIETGANDFPIGKVK